MKTYMWFQCSGARHNYCLVFLNVTKKILEKTLEELRYNSTKRVQQMNHNHTHLSILKGVTISGKVRFCAMVRGTPTWSIRRFGSGVMTVRAEKSTRFPIRLPRIRPSFAFSRCLIDFNGRPDFWTACA